MADAVVKFSRIRRELTEFISDNQHLFDQFFALTDQYNAALASAKEAVRELDPPGPLTVGPFKRGKAPESIEYMASKLPDHVKLLPGVIKKIDVDTLNKLVMDGTISGEMIRDARTSVLGTPRIEGPKEVVVKL